MNDQPERGTKCPGCGRKASIEETRVEALPEFGAFHPQKAITCRSCGKHSESFHIDAEVDWESIWPTSPEVNKPTQSETGDPLEQKMLRNLRGHADYPAYLSAKMACIFPTHEEFAVFLWRAKNNLAKRLDEAEAEIIALKQLQSRIQEPPKEKRTFWRDGWRNHLKSLKDGKSTKAKT